MSKYRFPGSGRMIARFYLSCDYIFRVLHKVFHW